MLEAEQTINVFKRYLQKPFLVVSDSNDLKTCPSAHISSIYISSFRWVASCYQICPDCGIPVN